MAYRKEIKRDSNGNYIYPEWKICSIRVTNEFLERIERVCAKQHWSFNQLAKLALEAYCDQYEGVEMDEMARKM